MATLDMLTTSDLRTALAPFGYDVREFVYDCGGTVYITGPGIIRMVNDRASADCGEDVSPAGALLRVLIRTGVMPESALDLLVEKYA